MKAIFRYLLSIIEMEDKNGVRRPQTRLILGIIGYLSSIGLCVYLKSTELAIYILIVSALSVDCTILEKWLLKQKVEVSASKTETIVSESKKETQSIINAGDIIEKVGDSVEKVAKIKSKRK